MVVECQGGIFSCTAWKPAWCIVFKNFSNTIWPTTGLSINFCGFFFASNREIRRSSSREALMKNAYVNNRPTRHINTPRYEYVCVHVRDRSSPVRLREHILLARGHSINSAMNYKHDTTAFLLHVRVYTFFFFLLLLPLRLVFTIYERDCTYVRTSVRYISRV